MKIFRKKLIIVSLVIIGIVLMSFYTLTSDWFLGWLGQRKIEKFEREIIKIYQQDTYGGKTPQETYQMYGQALQEGDIELASKYYWWKEQEKERLKKLKEEGRLQEYVDGLPEWKEMQEEEYWDPDGKRYTWKGFSKETIIEKLPRGDGTFIEVVIPPGEYTREITFHLNHYANIWKIY